MAEVGLPHVLNEEGTAVGFDKFLVCSVATKVEQVGSINRFIAAKCEKYPKFVGLGADMYLMLDPTNSDTAKIG